MNRVRLPAVPADDSATVKLPGEIEQGMAGALDAWLEAPNWRQRGAMFDWLLTTWAEHETPNASRVAASVCMITSWLEQLGEHDLFCIEQAVVYRVSAHESWRAAAVRWFAAADPAEVVEYIASHSATFAVLATWLRAPAGGGVQ